MYQQIGKGRILVEGNRVAIVGYGAAVQQCLEAAKVLESYDITPTVADARFCKPLDTDLIRRLAKEHEILITVEEGSIGGFGSHVSHFLSLNGLLDGHLKVSKQCLLITYPQFSFRLFGLQGCISRLNVFDSLN